MPRKGKKTTSTDNLDRTSNCIQRAEQVLHRYEQLFNPSNTAPYSHYNHNTNSCIDIGHSVDSLYAQSQHSIRSTSYVGAQPSTSNSLNDKLNQLEEELQILKLQQQQQHNNTHHYQNHLRASICPLPTFNGESRLTTFLGHFGDTCLLNGWHDELTKGLWLRTILQDRARDILYDDCRSYSVLVNRLQTRFGDHLLKRQYEIILPSRRRKPNEDISHLAYDIRTMVSVVYADLDPQTREKLAIQHFKMSLNDPATQYELSQKLYKTLDETLAAVQLREMYFGVPSYSYNDNNHYAPIQEN